MLGYSQIHIKIAHVKRKGKKKTRSHRDGSSYKVNVSQVQKTMLINRLGWEGLSRHYPHSYLSECMSLFTLATELIATISTCHQNQQKSIVPSQDALISSIPRPPTKKLISGRVCQCREKPLASSGEIEHCPQIVVAMLHLRGRWKKKITPLWDLQKGLASQELDTSRNHQTWRSRISHDPATT